MKYFFVFITLCFFSSSSLLAQKKETTKEVGLSLSHLQKHTPLTQQTMVSKVHKAHLYLPKVNNPLVKVQQSVWLSQNFYYQTSPNPTWSNHNKLMNQQLLLGNSPRDLLVDRAIEAAIGRLFGLD